MWSNKIDEKLYKKFPHTINLTLVKRSFYRRLPRTKIYKQDNRMNIYLFTYHIISIFISKEKKKCSRIVFVQLYFLLRKIFRNYLLTGSCLIKHYTKQTKHFNFLSVGIFTVIILFFFVSYIFSYLKCVVVCWGPFRFSWLHYWRYLAQKKLNKLFNKRNSSGCK